MALREYETVVVLDHELSEEELKEVFAKLENIIKSHNGILKEIEKWGIKSLAFKVSRKERGYYAVLRYYGKVDIIGEMERNIKIDNRIIRFITIKVKAEVEPDVIMVAEAEA